MYSKVSSLFTKYTAAAATYYALSPQIDPSSAALNFYALLAVGLGVFPAVEFFQEWAQGKKIGEIRDYLHKSILPKMAGAEIAVEDLAERYPDAIAEMPEDDARKPFAVLLNLMSCNWDDQTAFAEAFADYQEEWKSSIEENQAWQEQLSNWLLLHQETLVRELDFTRDDISDLSVAVHQLHQELFDELRSLRPQPPLILAEEVYNPEEHQQKLARFVFTHRRVSHIGRATEQKALHDFLMSGTDRCRWWMLTAPGGVGKSRLALETVLYAKSRGWLAGFLKDLGKSDGSYNDWEGWKPDRPTLIVVDYNVDCGRLCCPPSRRNRHDPEKPHSSQSAF
ncbi:hypothetical protein KOR42_06370 [Thalassoglobus neptunius]|uniref:Uncharacterized protein n=1 Tax=Thalassoglobus neptunius TaxID=1938619 RepID=A0A5C5X3A2_9PLAN|nr:hypothetical protein [Thalassoglobus neptunius]TWT57278.1 hypothetical protein KOR42_06370 [Thalassoglobus neptunius]